MGFPGFSRAGRDFFAASPLELAPRLLGGLLARGPVAVRVAEVEAYWGALDPGSHAYRGMTARNRSMFGEPGRLYCYFSHGLHFALNVVCGAEGEAAGCLIRAGRVVAGADVARARRAERRRDEAASVPDAGLARGPGNLARVFAADLSDDGADLCGEGLDGWSWWTPAAPVGDVARGPRIGVGGEGGDPDRFDWRFWLPGEACVSRFRPGPGVVRSRSSDRG